MPLSFDNAPAPLLHGLLRPELDFLGRMPFWAPALTGVAVALAVAVLMLVRSRSRPFSLCTPGGGASREEAVGPLRRAKAELRGRQGEAAVAAVLARAGYPALHDVIVRDAWGLTQVDHLVRLADGIVVVETKAYSGTVTGGVRDRLWVQELRGGRVRMAFRNPVVQNERHVRAVRRVGLGGGLADDWALLVPGGLLWGGLGGGLRLVLAGLGGDHGGLNGGGVLVLGGRSADVGVGLVHDAVTSSVLDRPPPVFAVSAGALRCGPHQPRICYPTSGQHKQQAEQAILMISADFIAIGRWLLLLTVLPPRLILGEAPEFFLAG